MDFRFCKNLAQDTAQFWSTDRWALTGEAGAFADPFYSPGSDFIGINNTFVADLVSRERKGEDWTLRATLYERMYRSFYESTMSLYEGQYAGFGDTRLMVVKTTWDYAYYWSVLSWLFFRNVLTDLDFLLKAQPRLVEMRDLNNKVQAAFRQRAAEGIVDQGSGRFIDQTAIPVIYRLNAALHEQPADIGRELEENRQLLGELATVLLGILASDPAHARSDCSLTGDLAQRLN